MSSEHLAPYVAWERLCQRPVFVIGSPRSGTTALAKALGEHPELWVSKESYFLHELFGLGRARRVWRHNMERTTPSWLRFEGVEEDELLGFLGLGVNALYTSRSRGRRWVEQTPLYTPMVADLASMFPGALFVHIVRDGRAVVRSMRNFDSVFADPDAARLSKELPAWNNDLVAACETWQAWVDTALTFAAEHPDRCMTVRNEALAADPAANFGAILSFLGLSEDDAPAVAFGGPRVNSSFATRTAPPTDRLETWEAGDRKLFADIAGATLVRAGYATASELDEWAMAEP